MLLATRANPSCLVLSVMLIPRRVRWHILGVGFQMVVQLTFVSISNADADIW